jgi:hypothetical protein
MELEDYKEIAKIVCLTRNELIKELIRVKFNIHLEEQNLIENAEDIPWT